MPVNWTGISAGLDTPQNYYVQIAWTNSLDIIDLFKEFVLNNIFLMFCLILLVFIFIGVNKR